MGGSASYRLARKIRAAEQNGASQKEIDALRRQREAALAVEREKRQRQRDQNENKVRILNIPGAMNNENGEIEQSNRCC